MGTRTLGFAIQGDWKVRTRTVELHEGIERPPLGILVLSMLVSPAQRQWFEVSSVRELWVILNLRSPLVKKISQGGTLVEERA
jgi:hypothetical protein